VGGLGVTASRKLIAVIKDIWLPNHAQFCVFSSSSQEFSCEPNFGGGLAPRPLAVPVVLLCNLYIVLQIVFVELNGLIDQDWSHAAGQVGKIVVCV